MTVVGGDQRDRTYFCQFNDLAVNLSLFGDGIFLQFEEEAAVREKIAVEFNFSSCPIPILAPQGRSNNPAEAGA